MINWSELKHFDVKNFDLTKIDLRRVDLPEFPELDLPVEADRVIGIARDAAYASVGAVIIGVQKAVERRRELADQLAAHVRKLVDTVA